MREGEGGKSEGDGKMADGRELCPPTENVKVAWRYHWELVFFPTDIGS